MATIKQQRTAAQIQTLLSDLFLFDVSDPRLAGLTITDVKIDRELQHANIYVNALGEEERESEVMDALDRAHGYLRRAVARGVQLRNAPQLHFHWDPTLAHAEQINSLLDSLDIPPAEQDDAPDSAESADPSP